MATKTVPGLREKTYHEIWLAHLGRMLSAGYSESDARRSHTLWKSLGKKAAKGRL